MEKKPSKKDRIKKYIDDHIEVILPITVITAGVLGFVAVARDITKTIEKQEALREESLNAYNSWADEQNAWIDKKHDEGKMVYLLHDYTYLAIPEDTQVEWIEQI